MVCGFRVEISQLGPPAPLSQQAKSLKTTFQQKLVINSRPLRATNSRIIDKGRFIYCVEESQINEATIGKNFLRSI